MNDSIMRDWMYNGCRHYRIYKAGTPEERILCVKGHKLTYDNAEFCVLHCKDRKRDTHIVV